MTHPLLEQLLSGTEAIYLVLIVIVVIALALTLGRLSGDPYTHRRALVVVGLTVVFALIRFELGRIAVDTDAYQIVSVAMLIIGYLAILLFTMLLVDFLLVRRFKVQIPNILRDVTVFALFFLGLLLILYYRTTLDITGLFTTSAVISIVLGLALQDTLGNVFSGLALQTERSFNVGDWVRFHDLEGVITDISWRSTKLRTRSNELVIIPNSVISKDHVINYSSPTRIHAVMERIGTHYRHPPAEVIAAIEEAAEQAPGVLRRPAVDVRTVAFGDFAIEYDVKYWIRDYADLEDIKNAFMTRVWYAFDRRRIEIPFPIRNVFMHEVTPATRQDEAEADDARIYDHLRRIEMFDPLSDEEARDLVSRVRVARYFSGETVLRQGRAGDSLFIIEEGEVQVIVDHGGRREKVAQLGPGSFFGEMALLTGAVRTATVETTVPTMFFVIDREVFRETLEANPELTERISRVLIERSKELEATHAALHEDDVTEIADEPRQVMTRIRDFFGFGG